MREEIMREERFEPKPKMSLNFKTLNKDIMLLNSAFRSLCFHLNGIEFYKGLKYRFIQKKEISTLK